MACLRDNFTNGTLLDNGRFETLAPLNHGSFGMVFMARDNWSNQIVAIKCLTKPSASADAQADGLATDVNSEELEIHHILGSHPYIVNLIHAFETAAHSYLVLEFCSRGDLYEAIRNDQGPLETEHVRQFMLQLVEAVSYSHSKGVYHRDIKPENIFLDEAGTLKLGDFGLATTETWTNEATVGSDRYMSPEQFDSAGAGYSPAQADIWAIGICLLNVLFSRNPFTTPTEADPLFLDFSRDKQSLFDVFPSMSQDTFEVIVHCMNLDPKKRSLSAVRNALNRVISFTTSDEAFDEFCAAEGKAGATNNREPLRTPSIQSPHVDQGAFPWAKALQETQPRMIRQLSAIPDEDCMTEDLFPQSEQSGGWFTNNGMTPSMASVMDSQFGVSMNSFVLQPPVRHYASKPVQSTHPSMVSGSLPISMTKPRTVATPRSVGRRHETFSKSWSDMWEEDMEEEEQQHFTKLETLKEINSRSWSQESIDNNKNTSSKQGVHAGILDESTSRANASPPTIDIDDDLVADGFFFQSPPPPAPAPIVKSIAPRASLASPLKHVTPSKRADMDKWAALGERRRAQPDTPELSKSMNIPRRKAAVSSSVGGGSGCGSSFGLGGWDNIFNYQKLSKDRTKDRPWNNHGRDWNWRKDRRTDLGDVEWVGAWQEAQS